MSFGLVAGAVFSFLAVALGAFGAHALRRRVSAEMLAVYKTGVEYHMSHALALLFTGAVADRVARPGILQSAEWLFILGILLFSGSLYALSITGIRRFGAITPIGGVLFLAGWVFVVLSVL